MKIKISFLLIVGFAIQTMFGQDYFSFNNEAKRMTLPFKLVNNLVVIPLTVNGVKLSFLLDTGVSNTVILNIKVTDSLKLKNTKKIRIQGLGEGDYVEAIKSTNNQISIGKHIINNKHKVYLILGKGLNLSNRMGAEIHGIIGGELFKDFVVKINYSSKIITFYKPKLYKYKKCRRCETMAISYLYGKPYINTNVELNDSTKLTTKLLVDTGGSDALWLFENSKKKLQVPKKYFYDYLGQGLNGNIYGKRSRIRSLSIGKYKFDNVTVSFPDTLSLSQNMRHHSRHGSLGSETLKRFNLIIDYPHNKLTFKKNSRFFSDPYNYNMSGIEVAYNGEMLVKEQRVSQLSSNNLASTDKGASIEFQYNYVLSLKPSLQITNLRKDSPAELSGVKVGDFILEVNRKPIYTYSIQDLMRLFYSKEGTPIKLLIARMGAQYTYEFKLKKIL